MALTLRGESFSMPLGDPLPNGLRRSVGHIRSLRVSQLRGL
jgi:hypothetical protein